MEERVDLLPKRSFEPGTQIYVESQDVLGDEQSTIWMILIS